MSIHVQLERFEGPLGLLLHLIREQEMDIFNINIHQITRQYLEYIKTMRRLDLEVAGEFVAMAATLLHIKSRMLLPQYNEEGEVVTEDPRKELVQKLVEYKKIRELSGELYKRPLLGRDVFTRGETEDLEAVEEGELVLEENPLFSLISSFRMAMKNMKKTVHNVTSSMKSIAERVLEIKDLLIVGQRTVMRELITEVTGPGQQVLLTFLSLLELAKMGFISIFQTEPFADIFIDTKRTIDRDVVSQVESYDSVNAAAKAEEIISDAQLSLDEAVPMYEGEEAPVVEATFADAATDEEIAAEEALLEGGGDIVVEGPGLVAEEIRTEESFIEATNGPVIMGFEEEVSQYDADLVTSETSNEDAIAEIPEVAMEMFMSNETVAEDVAPIISGDLTDVDVLIVAEAMAVEAPVEATMETMDEAAVETPEQATMEATAEVTVEVQPSAPVETTRPIEFRPQMIQAMPEEFLISTDEVTVSENETAMQAETAESAEAARSAETKETPEITFGDVGNLAQSASDVGVGEAVETHDVSSGTVIDQTVHSALTEALAAFDSFNEIEPDKKAEEIVPPEEEKPPEVES